jgi:hypothetical protein
MYKVTVDIVLLCALLELNYRIFERIAMQKCGER